MTLWLCLSFILQRLLILKAVKGGTSKPRPSADPWARQDYLSDAMKLVNLDEASPNKLHLVEDSMRRDLERVLPDPANRPPEEHPKFGDF